MKITKNQRIETLERKVAGLTTMLTMLQVWSDHADNMLEELNHALPDPEYDAKCEAQEADINASLDRHRERLGLNKPQLKTLDQSVFDGLNEKWKWAATDKNGEVWVYCEEPKVDKGDNRWSPSNKTPEKVGEGYDTTDWQNSLIERDDIAKELLDVDLSRELTGSDLCRAMLARGDTFVLCAVSDESEEFESGTHDVICGVDEDGLFESYSAYWWYVKPVNNQGEPLTASEVGL